MKNGILLFCFTLLVAFQNGFSQFDKNALVKSRSKFYYQNKVYPKKDLGKLFQLDETSFRYYKRHKRAKKIFNVSAISTLTLAGGALMLISINGGDSCYELCPHHEVGIYMFLASWLSAAATIISLPISIHNFKKAKSSFNTYAESVPKMGSVPMELNFNYTGNGMGIVLNF